MMRVAGVVLAVQLLAGCSLPSPPPVVSSSAAAKAVGGVLQLNLSEVSRPAVPPLDNVLAILSGSAGNRIALVVVFDSATATKQLTASGSSGALPNTRIVRVDNVVVIYRRDTSRARITRALSSALPR